MPGHAENPYSSLLQLMRSQGAKDAPPGWGIGIVASVDPFTLTFGGVTLSSSQLFIPEWLSASRWTQGAEIALLPNADNSLFLLLGERTV